MDGKKRPPLVSAPFPEDGCGHAVKDPIKNIVHVICITEKSNPIY